MILWFYNSIPDLCQCKQEVFSPARHLTWKTVFIFPMQLSVWFSLYCVIPCCINRQVSNLSATPTNIHKCIVSVKQLCLIPFLPWFFFSEKSFVVSLFHSYVSAVDKLFLFTLIHFLLFFCIFLFFCLLLKINLFKSSAVYSEGYFEQSGCFFKRLMN